MTEKSSKGWAAVKRHLKDWDATQLTGLLKDLYESAASNRAFLDARVQADDGGGAALESYRQRIVEQFYPKRGFGKLKLSEARKAIREYKKATRNVDGTIELLLTYLENGTRFTCDFGDINLPFYNSLCSVVDELAVLLQAEGLAAYEKVQDRLNQIVYTASGIGWGYGDHVNAAFTELEAGFDDA